MLDNKKLFLNKSSVNKLMKGLLNINQGKSDHISIPFISKPFIFKLIEQASNLHFRKAKTLVGNSVTQDFEVCFPALRDGAIDTLATSIESLFLEAINSLDEPPIKSPKFNDIAMQRYVSGSVGISPHKDHKKYISVIIIVTLSGRSNFCVCEDRDGINAKILDDRPGNILILPATGFKVINNVFNRPIHFVNNISDGRLSIGLRQNSEIN